MLISAVGALPVVQESPSLGKFGKLNVVDGASLWDRDAGN